ncbi:MAG: hypothetical protein AB1345_05230 [Chloroflexota bacterium]
MSEVRCPMCGKTNPEELENCQFCQARLKPLIAPSPDDKPRRIPEDVEKPEGRESVEFEPDTEIPESVIPPSEEDEGVPEWLASIRTRAAEEGFTFEEEERAEAQFEEGEEPEWLTRLRTKQGAEGEVLVEGIQPEEEEQEAGYLERIRVLRGTEISESIEVQLEEEKEVEPEEESSVESEIPEWIAEDVDQEAVVSEEAVGEDYGVKWLRGTGERADYQISEEVVEEELSAPLEGTTTEEIAVSLEAEEEIVEQRELPEWLADFEEEVILYEEEEIPEGEVDSVREAQEALETPGTVREPEEAKQAQIPSKFSFEELPDWLGESLEEDVQIKEPAEEQLAEEEELLPADLPTWLKAMRPVDSISATISDIARVDEDVLTVGPLAGLRGVIPAEIEVSKPQAPPAYPLKLRVSEKQQEQAVLFEQMIVAEEEPKPILKPKVGRPSPIWRWLLTLLLIAAVLWPIISDRQNISLPTLPPAGVLAASELISSLEMNAKVLIGFDYQPGLSGELDAAAQSAVEHVLMRGALVTLVSTQPTGPALAVRFFQDTQAEYNYTWGQRVVNLGYIPGGPVGLYNFARLPQRAKPYTVEGYSAWGGEAGVLAPLQGIQQLSDFDMVMVITEEVDVARSWIEQVQPVLASTPLIMVVSAQAEPLIRPYFEATPNQVQGLVVGLAGGAAFQQLEESTGLARTYWDSLSTASLLAAALILLGGLVSSSLAIFERQNQERRAV